MALYYFRNANGNWGTAASWSLSDGGPADGSVPTSADDARFTSNSGSVTINTNARPCNSANFTGYSGTVTSSFGLNITAGGSITLSSTMAFSGTSTWTCLGSSTLTSNGKIFLPTLWLNGTTTVADSWSNNNLLVFNSATSICNGGNVTCAAGLGNATNASISGTSKFIITGGSLGSQLGTISNDIDIQGTITANTSLKVGGGSTIKLVSGSLTTLSVGSGTININSNNNSWTNILINSSVTLNLLNTFNATGTLTTSTNNIIFTGAYNATIASLSTTTGDITFVAGQTYTFTTGVSVIATTVITSNWISSIGGTQAKVTLSSGATMNIDYCNSTDIDSSLGRTIYSYGGTLSNTINWKQLTNPVTLSSSSY